MISIRLGAALVSSALVFSGAPAFAASPISNAFMANVQSNVGFLAASSRIALDRSTSQVVRTFADAEAADAARIDLALAEARPNDGTTKLAAVDTDALMTGRSVSIDVPTGGPAKAANGRAPLGAADLAALGKLSGKKLDDALWQKQLDALSQLRSDYQAYADDGDDPALAAMAQRELSKVEARLAALSKI